MIHLNNFKQRAFDEFRKLINLIEGDDPCIPTQINLVDRMLTHLKFYYNYYPEWEDNYNELVEKYFGTMIFKVKEFCKN